MAFGTTKTEARKDLADQYSAAQKELSELQRTSEEYGGGPLTDAAEAKNKTVTDFSYARQGVSAASQLEQSRKMEVENAKKGQDSYINEQLKALSEKIGVSEQKLQQLLSLAYVYKERYDSDLKAALEKAKIEIFSDQHLALMEIIRVILACASQMHAAELGTKSSAVTTFSVMSQWRSLDPRDNPAIGQFAQARTQQGEIDAEAAQLERMRQDPYWNDKISEAMKALSQAQTDEQKANDEVSAAKAEQAVAESGFRAARGKSDKFKDDEAAAREKAIGIGEELRKLEDEESKPEPAAPATPAPSATAKPAVGGIKPGGGI